MRKFSVRPVLILKGRTFKGLRGWSGKPLHPPLTDFPIAAYIFTAVFDERIKVIVSSCGFDSFVDYYGGDPGVWKPERGWCQTRYMPRLAQYAGRLNEIPFDFHELIGALAPRHVFVNAPLGDTNFKWRSVDAVVTAARPVFELYHVAQNLRVEHPDCGHLFPPEMRQMAYKLFDENLR